MYSSRIVEQVIRAPKPLTGVLKVVMIVFAVIFLLLGVVISRGFMLSGFLFVVLYYFYNVCSRKEYEYILEDNQLAVDVILGQSHRRSCHVLDMDGLEVLAPNWHDAVAGYRKNGGDGKVPKYDYTSEEENKPLYTMIITEGHKKIKVLLEMSDNVLRTIKTRYPDRVYLE